MAKKKQKEAAGCRLCKYRVSVPVKQAYDRSERVPSCCFQFKVNDKDDMHRCSMFVETDFYVKHPDEV